MIVTTVAYPNQVLEPRSRSQNTSRFLVGVAYAVLIIIHAPVNFRQKDPGDNSSNDGFQEVAMLCFPEDVQ